MKRVLSLAFRLDQAKTVSTLFRIVNFIIEEMITRPREIERIYNKLPQGAKKHIEDRDKGM